MKQNITLTPRASLRMPLFVNSYLMSRKLYKCTQFANSAAFEVNVCLMIHCWYNTRFRLLAHWCGEDWHNQNIHIKSVEVAATKSTSHLGDQPLTVTCPCHLETVVKRELITVRLHTKRSYSTIRSVILFYENCSVKLGVVNMMLAINLSGTTVYFKLGVS